MKLLFYLGHPAHYHLFRPVIRSLQKNKHDILVTIRKKDILEDLLNRDGLEYENILPKGRGNGLPAIAWSMLKKDLALYKLAKKYKPYVMIGTSAEIGHVGKLLKIYSIIVNEDDFDVVPHFSKMAYPFGSSILAPSSCRMGKWRDKSVLYEGYHELTYLHPKHFTPDINILNKYHPKGERYFVLRFAQLTAHHDAGKTGITNELAKEIIKILEPFGAVYVTSERSLEPHLDKYRMNINPIDIHHFLSYADLYIGDSQTMAAEAAVLGTPSLRFNDFVGRIGYLEELEHKYGLTFGIKTSSPEELLKKISELVHTPNLKEEWNIRQQRMLEEKIDVTAFMAWFFESYPESVQIMYSNPDFQYNFVSRSK